MRFVNFLVNQCLVIVMLLFATLYFLSVPLHIQGGDTAELVNSAKNLFIAHPPGYPLWIFAEWLWLNFFQVNTLFWQASLLSSFYALGVLLLVLLPLRKKPSHLILTSLTIALSTAFFEAAVLPDVFALHGLIVATISYLFLFKNKDSIIRQTLIPFFFILGMAHHHTIVFLFPLIIFTFLENLKNKQLRNAFIGGSALGIVTLMTLYGSLIFLRSSDYLSWGNISSIKDLISHFLRTDYGTFSFSPIARNDISRLDSIMYFLKLTGLELSALLLVAVVSLIANFKRFLSAQFLIWFFTIIFSLSFFLMTNFKMEGMGLEIITRFHVMPAILLAFTCSFIFSRLELKSAHKIIAVCALVAIIPQSLTSIKGMLPLRHDSIFEDYSNNLLKTAVEKNAQIILIENDNIYFGLRLLQSLKPDYNKIAVISPPLLFNHWYFEKIQSKLPYFKLLNTNTIWNSRSMDLSRDLIEPNIQFTNILITKPLAASDKFKATQLGLGQLLGLGSGKSVEEELLKTKLQISNAETLQKSRPQQFSKKLIFSEYAYYYLSVGLQSYKKQDLFGAKAAWIKALSIVPYCLPALKNICEKDPKAADCSLENLQRIQNESQLIF